ncbi:MAG: anchored repeat-type ABC transporter ATP-binding subunit [Corynebacterium sp.]|nr:anchored repeat-type ABC transporter ATP-binding subunit [Corynebacterium sp.]
MSTQHNLLDAKNIRVELSGRQVIKDASLSIAPGEFVGLLGPNGAGKTTLLRAILGLIPRQGGSVHLTGSFGYVPQRHDVAWDFPLTVEQAVLNGRCGIIGWLGRATKQDRDHASHALDLVKLSDLHNRPIGELSGGQRQRVLIARALATDPQLLVLDEPFTGLDAPSIDAMLELFDALIRTGTSIIMSTHNLAEATHNCARLILFRGDIVADGSAEVIRSHPDPWVEAFGVAQNSAMLRSMGVIK